MQKQADNHYHTFREIVNQSLAWEAVLGEVAIQATAIRNFWKGKSIQEVIFTGCGSTYYLARTAAAIFQGTVGSLAKAHPASDILLFPHIALSHDIPRMLVAILVRAKPAKQLVQLRDSRHQGTLQS